MNPDYALGRLETWWRDYLVQRGHYIYRRPSYPCAVRSRNSNNKRYCWLILVGKKAIRRLSKPERAYIRQHIKEAGARKETAYLVVGFTVEPACVVILPAGAGLKAQRVRRDTGGIAWVD